MSRRNKIIYWIATLWLALGMVSTGVVQLLQLKSGAGGLDQVTQLGYPGYFLKIIGVWKILGSVALLIPGYALLKEWAYAGFFFAMSGAAISHLASHSASQIYPSLLLLVLTFVSWYMRPADRKLIPSH